MPSIGRCLVLALISPLEVSCMHGLLFPSLKWFLLLFHLASASGAIQSPGPESGPSPGIPSSGPAPSPSPPHCQVLLVLFPKAIQVCLQSTNLQFSPSHLSFGVGFSVFLAFGTTIYLSIVLTNGIFMIKSFIRPLLLIVLSIPVIFEGRGIGIVC